MINEENLNEEATRKFLDNSFRDGEVKTTGTDIEKILPAMRRFGNSNKAERKQTIIDKLKKFFEKYFGLNSSNNEDDEIKYEDSNEEDNSNLKMIAEKGEEYKRK